MANNSCFICNETLSSGKIVIVDRGLQTIKNASIERNDGHINFLQNVNTVTVHIKCRKSYTKKFNIDSYKKRHVSDSPATSQSPPRKRRSTSFDFDTLCMFCGKLASEEQERKKHRKYQRIIRHVSTLSFKDTVIEAAEARNDSCGEIVKNRINLVHDLVAVNAIYHNTCFDHFLFPSSDRKKGRPADNNISNAMNEIFNYIENHEDCQFTLEELKGIPKEHVPADRTIINKLIERYGQEIIITTKFRSMTVICFRDTQANILCSSSYDNSKKNPKEERLRILETAASIIREDITLAIVDTEFYPPPAKMLDNVNADIPEGLTFLLEEIIVKHKKGKKDKLRPKCTAISHAIMTAVRPRTFTSPLLVGLSVFIHRRYGSKRLLDILSTLGLSGSYHDAVRYEVSSVCHPQPTIQSPTSGAMIQYAADNADINIFTLDGYNTIHIMGIISIITPKDAVINETSIVKCRKLPRFEQLAMKAHVPLLMYESSQICGLSKITVKNFNYEETSGIPTFRTIDLLWMFGKSRGVSHLPGWNGFTEYLTVKNVNFLVSRILFSPFIHHPASNINTIYTTLKCALENSKNYEHEICIITFDQPLYIKAREIVAAAGSDTELFKVIVRRGGFYMLMSFLGCIGYVMAGRGIKEELSVIYAPNSVDKMLNGHAFARSIRGHTLLRFILLIGRCLIYQNIYFLKPGKGKTKTEIYNPWAIIKYANCRDHILFLHAISGCDTTCAFFRRGKINAFKLLQKRSDLQQAAEVFKQENCLPDTLIHAGISFILAMYGAPKTESSLDNYRYLTFAKCTRLNKPVELLSLPPTSAAAQQHVLRVYYQVQTWLGRDLDPQQWPQKNSLILFFAIAQKVAASIVSVEN